MLEPDLILHNGRIVTLDGASRIAEAVAIRAGRIAEVGSADRLLSLAGPATRRIDLAGHAVTPGFFDAHAHMDREGLKARGGVPIAGLDSVADIKRAVTQAAAGTPKGDWIVVMPMGNPPHDYVSRPEQLREGRFPDRFDLDQAAPDHPVYIRAPWGWWSRAPFPSVANSTALALAGVTRETRPPHRVEILKDADGEPNGVFLERNYTPILEYTLFRAVPRFTEVDRADSVRLGSAAYSRAGVTAIYEGHGLTPTLLNAYREVHQAGELSLRVVAPLSVPTAAFDNRRIAEMLTRWADRISGRGSGDAMLRYEGICLDVGDPTVASILCHHYPYEQWSGHFYQSLPLERLVEIGVVAARLGVRVNCLVCYDLERVLRAYEEIDRQVSIRDRRWVVVHVTEASDDQIRRIRALGLIATVTPNFMYMAEDRFGLDKLRERGIPIRRLLDAGVPVALSSDNVPPSMLWTMWEAIARWDADSQSRLGPSELSREEALRIATQSGHLLSWSEDSRGSIEVGKAADLVELAEDPLTCEEGPIKDIAVVRTLVGGRVVHGPAADHERRAAVPLAASSS